ncbi:SpoIIIAH-like family protein [Paenibacillus sp. TRM 82003]|nr:SpoIIIAH-like family protein [Paenibacillus sp. TRM 82003]
MNTRRQTVWLVSMLGLMVVLSAYYLFTDEASEVPIASNEQVVATDSEIVVEGVGMMDPTATSQQQVSIDNIAPLEGEQAAEGEATAEGEAASEGEVAAEGEATAEGETPPTADATQIAEATTDEAVLEQVANRSGADAITTLQIDREAEFSRQLEELTAAMIDETASDEQIAEAVNKHNELMDLEAKLIAFEEKMLTNYQDIAVVYDSAKDHFTINVLAAQLEKSEAVSLVSEAITDLKIGTHQVSVKLHQ